ncbi:hypothetical protein G3545_02920 [Starkeya sp. ORNL1]|uniref:hypothetical protein n=1 Tax=Starkeya sp. ORNL1 TaxID=2709380 RepID=UPI00146364B6|nr:hypothetical protein [Starkeya sp. ORNL1]QJP12706.1 hypothetical protein G3545_02920 [Starkeya sp. ORNL1]
MQLEGEAVPKSCFIVSPIGEPDSRERVHAEWVAEMIIRPVLNDIGDINVERSDDINTPGLIDSQIIDRLLNVDLVIADLSFLNPNVFYEIGIRHLAQKPIIHLQLESERIPFDVLLYRSIKFSISRPRDIEAAKLLLKNQINVALAPDYIVENPVTRTRGRVELAEHATPEMQTIMRDIEALSARVSRVENGSEALSHMPRKNWYDLLKDLPSTAFIEIVPIPGEDPDDKQIMDALRSGGARPTAVNGSSGKLRVSFSRTQSFDPHIIRELLGSLPGVAEVNGPFISANAPPKSD